jgi:hypothetical protein
MKIRVTATFVGTVEIEAPSESAAIEILQEGLAENTIEVDFSFENYDNFEAAE